VCNLRFFAEQSFEMAEIKDWSPEGGTPLILQHSNRVRALV
jgi:hypothetical protein